MGCSHIEHGRGQSAEHEHHRLDSALDYTCMAEERGVLEVLGEPALAAVLVVMAVLVLVVTAGLEVLVVAGDVEQRSVWRSWVLVT